MIICIIPARKGSKRIKNKNTKLFFGKPILEHVIQKVKKAKIFTKVFITTDSNKIAAIAKKNGVEVLMRSKHLSSDRAPIKPVIYDVIKKLKQKFIYPKKVCCIFPTSIFFSKDHLERANFLLKKNINFVFSAVKYSHPIQRSFYLQKDKIKMNFPKNEMSPTHKFSKSYYDAAQFYFGWTSSWIKKKPFFEGKNKFIEFKDLEVQDIDDNEDWKKAQYKFKNLRKKI